MFISWIDRYIWYHWFVYRFLVHKEGGGSGITPTKLKKYEHNILHDDYMWQDVLWRHNLCSSLPWEQIALDKANYDHAMGNFWGMIYPMFR